jgi:elongation factor Ts
MITAAQVKELRQATNVGMMECKRALTETDGDMDRAIKLLRERGMVIAGKKADRVANEGLVAARVAEDASLGVLIEVDCETDFVARNETFRSFVGALADKAFAVDGDLAEICKDELVAKIAEMGENLVIRRQIRFARQGEGAVASYIHLGAKIGVLVEVGCEKPGTASQPAFQEMVKDLCLHIAAAKPPYLTRDEVPADLVAAERDIFAKQAEGKPANIVEKIVLGKLEKFFAQSALVEQGFVKDPDRTVSDLLRDVGKQVDDVLCLRRYALYQIGG